MGQRAWEKRPDAPVTCAMCVLVDARAVRVLSVEAMAAAEALSSGQVRVDPEVGSTQ